MSYIVSPSGFISLLFAAGLAAILFRRVRALGCASMAAGGLLFILLSIGPVSYALLKPLEFKYEAFEPRDTDAGFIVVMAGYALDEKYYPVSSRVNSSSVFRLVEALNLWRLDESRMIVISGRGDVPAIMAEVLSMMGVASEKIMIENASSNSYESARNVLDLVQQERFILVTSAGHMPRCMAVFKKMEVEPIPAPTDYQVGKNPLKANFRPSVEHLYYSELALHEYFGLLWYRLRGRI